MPYNPCWENEIDGSTIYFSSTIYNIYIMWHYFSLSFFLSLSRPWGAARSTRGPMNFITAHIYRRDGSGGECQSRKLHRLWDKPPRPPRILLCQISARTTIVKSRKAPMGCRNRLTFRVLRGRSELSIYIHSACLSASTNTSQTFLPFCGVHCRQQSIDHSWIATSGSHWQAPLIMNAWKKPG